MSTSYNGWTASPDPDAIGIVRFEPLPGHVFHSGVRGGDVAIVLGYLVRQMHARVERIELYADGDEWGYNFRPNRNDPDSISCHGSGTAIDWNAVLHPNGKAGTFTSGQMVEIDRILAELDGVVRWGGDFNGTPDEMHFEICKDAAAVAAVARKLTTGETFTMDATSLKQLRAELAQSESDIASAVRVAIDQAVETVTGGKRVRDANGVVVDPDTAHVSNADLLTGLERLGDRIVAAIEAK